MSTPNFSAWEVETSRKISSLALLVFSNFQIKCEKTVSECEKKKTILCCTEKTLFDRRPPHAVLSNTRRISSYPLLFAKKSKEAFSRRQQSGIGDIIAPISKSGTRGSRLRRKKKILKKSRYCDLLAVTFNANPRLYIINSIAYLFRIRKPCEPLVVVSEIVSRRKKYYVANCVHSTVKSHKSIHKKAKKRWRNNDSDQGSL